jgi:hypothetical protein
MQAIITIFKTEFEGKEQVKEILIDLTEDVKTVSDAYIFSPRAGRLFDLLNVLRRNKIIYGTHFNSTSEGPKDNQTLPDS